MSDPRDHKDAYISADDVLLRGYCGPADFLQYRTWYPGVTLSPTHGYISRPGHGDDIAGYSPANIRLNPALAPVRDHIARVMAEGVGCPACGGRGWSGTVVGDRCSHCTGGYLLPPSPIEHLMDRHGSKLTAAQSAACVAWSYRSWRVGGPVLRGVIAPYYDAIDNGWGRVDCVGAGVSVGVYPRARENGQGWRVIFHGTDDTPDIEVSGPETGPDGRACADRAALAHNFALLNDDGSVTTPELPTDRSPK